MSSTTNNHTPASNGASVAHQETMHPESTSPEAVSQASSDSEWDWETEFDRRMQEGSSPVMPNAAPGAEDLSEELAESIHTVQAVNTEKGHVALAKDSDGSTKQAEGKATSTEAEGLEAETVANENGVENGASSGSHVPKETNVKEEGTTDSASPEAKTTKDAPKTEGTKPPSKKSTNGAFSRSALEAIIDRLKAGMHSQGVDISNLEIDVDDIEEKFTEFFATFDKEKFTEAFDNFEKEKFTKFFATFENESPGFSCPGLLDSLRLGLTTIKETLGALFSTSTQWNFEQACHSLRDAAQPNVNEPISSVAEKLRKVFQREGKKTAAGNVTTSSSKGEDADVKSADRSSTVPVKTKKMHVTLSQGGHFLTMSLMVLLLISGAVGIMRSTITVTDELRLADPHTAALGDKATQILTDLALFLRRSFFTVLFYGLIYKLLYQAGSFLINENKVGAFLEEAEEKVEKAKEQVKALVESAKKQKEEKGLDGLVVAQFDRGIHVVQRVEEKIGTKGVVVVLVLEVAYLLWHFGLM